eukprot:Nitzschia sp. Nitz4//scaffold13_size275219//4412//5336//NITZ4_000832-RA/size275219-est2genome-gene-0.316-mRNA-1//1//CDS//3329535886//7992//frame0
MLHWKQRQLGTLVGGCEDVTTLTTQDGHEVSLPVKVILRDNTFHAKATKYSTLPVLFLDIQTVLFWLKERKLVKDIIGCDRRTFFPFTAPRNAKVPMGHTWSKLAVCHICTSNPLVVGHVHSLCWLFPVAWLGTFFIPVKEMICHRILSVMLNLTEKSIDIVRCVPTFNRLGNGWVTAHDEGEFSITISHSLVKILGVIKYTQALEYLMTRLWVVCWPMVKDIHQTPRKWVSNWWSVGTIVNVTGYRMKNKVEGYRSKAQPAQEWMSMSTY